MPMSILPALQSLEESTTVWVTVVARPPLKVRWTVYATCAGLGDGLGVGLIAGADGDAVAGTLELDEDAAFEEPPHAAATSTAAARATTERTPRAADRACFMGEIVHPSQSHTQSRSGLKIGFRANGPRRRPGLGVESGLTARSVARVTWWGR